MHICVYVCRYRNICLYVYVYIHVSVSTYIYEHIFTCVSYICKSMCMWSIFPTLSPSLVSTVFVCVCEREILCVCVQLMCLPAHTQDSTVHTARVKAQHAVSHFFNLVSLVKSRQLELCCRKSTPTFTPFAILAQAKFTTREKTSTSQLLTRKFLLCLV